MDDSVSIGAQDLAGALTAIGVYIGILALVAVLAVMLPGAGSGAAVTTQAFFNLAVSLWPVGAALALAALAAVFRHGSDLQRHTAALQRETEGLV